jgi:hypothetical protein
MNQIFTKPNVAFMAVQFTEDWKNNESLKQCIRKYKDTYTVIETKQLINFGDFLLMTDGATLVVTADFMNANFTTAPSEPEDVKVAVTLNELGLVVAVTVQDDEGKVEQVIWEAPVPEEKPAEKQARRNSPEKKPNPSKPKNGGKPQRQPEEIVKDALDPVALEIKQAMVRNEVIDILNDEHVLLEKRIEQVKAKIRAEGKEASAEAIEHIKDVLELDLSNLFSNNRNGQKKQGQKQPQNKKVEKRQGQTSNWMRGAVRQKFKFRTTN